MSNNTKTPLRYPGGKSVLYPFLKDFISINNIQDVIYAEPYCGGAGAAIDLLLNGDVQKIILNDANIAIYSFWKSIVDYSDDFLNLLDNTPITIQEWHHQKKIFEENNFVFSIELGFATFYLNRCNRSGILSAGPIGGNTIEKQHNANYKIDARFNKEKLRKKIIDISDRRKNIYVFNLDALEFLNKLNSSNYIKRLFVYLDPPYYTKGAKLYMNCYNDFDHKNLSYYLEHNFTPFWLLSYDNVAEIRSLYSNFDLYTFNLSYTAQLKKKGSELLLHSKNTIFPQKLEISRSHTPLLIRKL